MEVTLAATGNLGQLASYEANIFSKVITPTGQELVLANYMNCECGTTLCILGKDRRGEDRESKYYRKLFNRILSKLVEEGLDKEKSSLFLRDLFRKLLQGEINEEQLERLTKEFYKI